MLSTVLSEQPYRTVFAAPSPETAAQGWKPGSVQMIGDVQGKVLAYQAPERFFQGIAVDDPDFEGLKVTRIEPAAPLMAGGKSAWLKVTSPDGMSGEMRCTTVSEGQTWRGSVLGWLARPGSEEQARRCFLQAVTSLTVDPGWAERNVPDRQALLALMKVYQERLGKELAVRYFTKAPPAAPQTLQLGGQESQAQAGGVCSLDPHRGKRPVVSSNGLLQYVPSNLATPKGAVSLSVSP